MPRRQRDSLVQSTLSFKKLKPHQDDVEDVPVETKYAVSYLWKKTQFYPIKETFAYLDLRTSAKFSRVAPAWRDIMLDTVAINKGIAFVDWRVGADFRGETQMERALFLAKFWLTLFVANLEGVTQFV
ncbi:hypothetical protein RvY_17334 [Ramazzottius varieornatus]|uniref:F-box domain-containing protein n=1 Tax=Ramazzottius varieornatus TaxID=947166 RepID=A0A1D1W5P2_RAMVA|nr:hypothetical protein RvY_17334 [Ramazzottius varieornatus]